MPSDSGHDGRFQLPSVSLSSSTVVRATTDAVVVAIRGEASLGAFEQELRSVGFTGRKDQLAVLPGRGLVKAGFMVAIGVPAEPTTEQLRRAAAIAARAARRAEATSVAFDFGVSDSAEISAVVEGALLGLYRFEAYSTPGPDRAADLDTVQILTSAARSKDAKQAVTDAVVVARAVCRTRDWVNTPPCDLRPPVFADQIAALAGSELKGVKVDVWDEARLVKERCGGILAVGAGSTVEPRLVHLSYSPKKADRHLALVGKGITFDSGGLSIKSGAGMMTMKMDMAGAASVVSAFAAIVELGLPIAVDAYACLAENMPSGSATRPGDIITMRSGKTVEVLNTDAEGRLVLGDGLTLAAEGKPDLIVDVATLTGACLVALGDRTTGVLGDDASTATVLAAAETTAEAMWRLPLTEEITSLVTSSQIADLRQIGPKPVGGTIFAAAFLREFTAERPWAHLDIAGPAFNDGGVRGHTPAGGTGASVRTLVQVARDLCS